MKATELRIGNYLKWKDNNQEFEITLSLFLSRDFWNHIKAGDILPIPLTEERLLKFGFKSRKNHRQIDGIECTLQLTGYKHEDGIINTDETWFSSCGTIDNGIVVLTLCRGNYVCNNVEYVHQLQNLYFALNGNELIK